MVLWISLVFVANPLYVSNSPPNMCLLLKDWPILLIFSKKKKKHCVLFLLFFLFHWFQPSVWLFLGVYFFWLWLFFPFSPRPFRCAVTLQLCELFIFFLKFRHLVLWTCLFELLSLCHKVRYVVYSFSFNSRISLNFFIISDWTSFSFSSEFSSHEFVNALLFLLMHIASSSWC